MRMTADQIERHLARVQAEPALRRNLLTYRIEDTDPIVVRHPLVILASGALVVVGLFAVIISVAEKVLG